MPRVPGDPFIGSLTDESHFLVLARALAHVIHRHDRAGGNRLFANGHDFGQRAFDRVAAQLDLRAADRENIAADAAACPNLSSLYAALPWLTVMAWQR